MSKTFLNEDENYLNEGNIRDWCKKFNARWTIAHDVDGHGCKSAVAVDFIQRVDTVVRAKQKFIINTFSNTFSRNVTVFLTLNIQHFYYEKAFSVLLFNPSS